MPRKQPAPETPLYVKLPNDAIEKLRRAAEALGVAKKDLVAGLVERYVDPDSQRGLQQLDAISNSRAGGGLTLGTYAFQAYEPPEIMTASQAGQFLQLDEKTVVDLAEAGELPGKKLGSVWRFSRQALVAWLAAPDR